MSAPAPQIPLWQKGLARTGLLAAAWMGSVALLYLLSRLGGFSGNLEGGMLAGVGRIGGWRLFWCLQIPAAMFLLSATGEFLIAWRRRLGPDVPGRRTRLKRYRFWDSLSLLAVPVLGLGLFFHQRLNDPLALLGLFYLLLLAAKGLLLGWLLWEEAASGEGGKNEGGRDRFAAWGLGLCAAMLLACLALWTSQALSTAGDEVNYLVKAHRLLARIGLASGDATSPQVLQNFYRGRWSPYLVSTQWDAPLMVALLMPAYALIGRLGALLLLAGGGGLCLAGVYKASRRMGYGLKESQAVAWLLGTSPVFVLFSQHVYPEMLGAAGAAWGIFLILAMDRRPLASLLGIMLLAGILGLIKMRMIPLGLGLVIAGTLRYMISQRRWWPLLAAGALALLPLAVMLFGLPGSQAITAQIDGALYMLGSQKQVLLPILSSVPAMVFDQQFGLLPYASWLFLSLAGLPFFWRDQRPAAYSSLMAGGLALAAIVLWRWMQWDGGFTPPGRLLAALTPLMAIWMLPALACRPSRSWRLVLLLVAGLNLAVTIALNAAPLWRYQRRTGASSLLMELGEATHSVLHRFFPSFINYQLQDMLPALAALGIMAGLGFWLWRARLRGCQTTRPPGAWSANLGLALVIGLAALAALVLAGRTIPTSRLEAESMRHQRAAYFGSFYPRPVWLLLLSQGSTAQTDVVWGKDSRELVLLASWQIVGKAKGRVKQHPLLGISADGRGLGVIELRPNKESYVLRPRLEPGMHRLKVTYVRQDGRDQIILDRILIH